MTAQPPKLRFLELSNIYLFIWVSMQLQSREILSISRFFLLVKSPKYQSNITDEKTINN